MKSLKFLFTAFLTLTISYGAFALTIEQALQKTLDAHPQINAKREEYYSAEKNVTGSLWQFGPGISLQTGRNSFDQKTTLTRIQQPLFMGGRTLHGTRESIAKRNVAQSDLTAVEMEYMSRSSDTYLELGKLLDRETAANANVAEHKRLLEMIQRRTQAGLNSENDVTTANMRLQQAMSELELIKSQTQSTKTQLEQLINDKVDLKTFTTPKRAIPFNLTLDATLESALAHSPLITSQKFKAEQAEAKSLIDRSSLLPQVYLRHDRYSGNVPDARTTTYIAVEYQFGNGVSSAYAWRASVNQQKSAASMVEATQNDVLITITRDWNQLNLTNLQLKIVENQLQSAQDVVDSFLRQFSVGKRSWLDVLNAQRELIGVRNSLIDIKSANQQSRVRLLINTNNVNLDNLAQLGINN